MNYVVSVWSHSLSAQTESGVMLGVSASQLVEIASHRTGLRDLGDSTFATALEHLVDSIHRESTLSEAGRSAAQERLLRVIVNRLRFQRDLKEHPEILEQPLEAPLVICGLPRVGSTKLHQLLAVGGDFQKLLFWQGFNPAPFPEAPGGAADPRIAAAAQFLEWRARLNPATNAAHYMAAQNPEEDTYLLEYTLHTYWPVTYFEVPSFLAWLKSQERDHAYRYLANLLRYLQWQFHRVDRKPWVLKSPPNFGYEGALARNLPGARFVVLHRDPILALPSAAGIVREVRRLYCGVPADGKKVGAWALEEYAAEMDRHLAWRRSVDAGIVLDVPYSEVRDDGVGVARQVYRFLGKELSEAAEARMRDWSTANAQHRHGVHKYSLEESGLSTDRINEKFAAYRAAFGRFLAH
jgi:hypothetical protein